MQNFEEIARALTSYVVAFLTLTGAFIVDNGSTIMQLLGFVLVVARLVKELPAAWRVINKWRGK